MSKILTAEKRGTDYYFKVHLDEAKVDKDGNPDPAFIREWTWGKPSAEVGERAYLVSITQQLRAMVAAELPPTRAVKPLALQGEVL